MLLRSIPPVIPADDAPIIFPNARSAANPGIFRTSLHVAGCILRGIFCAHTCIALSSAIVIALGVFVATSRFEAREGQDTAVTPNQAARPQRTEAEARQLAEKHRQDRARLAKDTGKAVELISDYVKAQMLPVPETLGVSPFYRKYV